VTTWSSAKLSKSNHTDIKHCPGGKNLLFIFDNPKPFSFSSANHSQIINDFTKIWYLHTSLKTNQQHGNLGVNKCGKSSLWGILGENVQKRTHSLKRRRFRGRFIRNAVKINISNFFSTSSFAFLQCEAMKTLSQNLVSLARRHPCQRQKELVLRPPRGAVSKRERNARDLIVMCEKNRRQNRRPNWGEFLLATNNVFNRERVLYYVHRIPYAFPGYYSGSTASHSHCEGQRSMFIAYLKRQVVKTKTLNCQHPLFSVSHSDTLEEFRFAHATRASSPKAFDRMQWDGFT